MRKAAWSFTPQTILKNIRIHLRYYLCSEKDFTSNVSRENYHDDETGCPLHGVVFVF